MSVVGRGVCLLFAKHASIDEGISFVLEDLKNSPIAHDQILILDCGSGVDLQLLAVSMSEDELSEVRYAQCFDLKGVHESFDANLVEGHRLVMVLGLKQVFDREKLGDYTAAHKLLNDVMLCVRKCSAEVDDVVLVESDDGGPSILDYYVDGRYVVKGTTLRRL